ncbi:MAG: hypothetical protein EXQ92_08090 [Alphaproteobacteria bacterium]|nr:hypothetical protein [Alphaproteobacteria bacterium]
MLTGHLTSGGTTDTNFYVFGNNSGTDIIADFSVLVDFVSIKSNVNGSGITSFANVVSNATDIVFGGLAGVAKSSLSTLDYVFF